MRLGLANSTSAGGNLSAGSNIADAPSKKPKTHKTTPYEDDIPFEGRNATVAGEIPGSASVFVEVGVCQNKRAFVFVNGRDCCA